MRYMLTFYAIENEWMALPQSEREAGIADIGQWFAEHGRAGKIVEGHRLGRGTKTVRLGRVRKKDLAMVSDGPFIEAKESVGSYAGRQAAPSRCGRSPTSSIDHAMRRTSASPAAARS